MNRTLFVIALGLGMTMAGCATDVDDPVPPAPVPEEQRDPPDRPLSTELRDPQALLLGGIEIDRGLGRVPANRPPPGPEPLPVAK